ncbi:MAG: hypothetical protein U0903_04085 [Planctomycetales bacterium]
MPIRRCCLLLSAFVLLIISCFAQGFEPIKGEEAHQLAARMIKQAEAAKLFLLPWKPASAEADGLSAKGPERLIVVPREALKENAVDPAVKTEEGAILGCIFVPVRFQPMVNDKKVDTARLPVLRPRCRWERQGNACAPPQLAIKLRNKDDWRLLVYGKKRRRCWKPHRRSTVSGNLLQITGKNGRQCNCVQVFMESTNRRLPYWFSQYSECGHQPHVARCGPLPSGWMIP